ncbi:hypothetical protein KEM52_005212 [Ascosphaera acerosa]|nr:hypothetical protein KEM52_005212 [Ascosphaera acerosa]
MTTARCETVPPKAEAGGLSPEEPSLAQENQDLRAMLKALQERLDRLEGKVQPDDRWSENTAVEHDNASTGSETLSNKSSITYLKAQGIQFEDRLIECLNRFEKNVAELAHKLSVQSQAATETSADLAKSQPELFVPVHVLTEDDFRAHHGFDITSQSHSKNKHAPQAVTPVLRGKTVDEFSHDVLHNLRLESGHVRLWAMISRQNKTIRPEEPLDDPDMTIEEAYVKFTDQDGPFQLYAEILGADESDSPMWSPSALVFFKCFDVAMQTLTGVGHSYIRTQSRIADLGKEISTMMDWSPGTEVLLFEEVKHNLVQPLKPKQTLEQAEIGHGDIIVFQRRVPEEQLRTVHCADARQYYAFLYHQREIVFIPLKSGKTFTLMLNGKMSYEQWTAEVATHLGVETNRLRFAPSSQQSGLPKSFIKRRTSRNLSYILRGSSTFFEQEPRRDDRLFYEVLDETLDDFETTRSLPVTWLPNGIAVERQVEVHVPQDGIIRDVSEALRRRVHAPSTCAIRLIQTYDDKIHSVLDSEADIRDIDERAMLYAEPVPSEELQMEDGEFMIHAFNFDKDAKNAHGVPFRFVLRAGESVREMRKRLAMRTSLRADVIDSLKVALVDNATNVPLYYDDAIISNFVSQFKNGCMLGLDYPEDFSIVL